MKIISKPDTNWSDKLTCDTCTSVLEVDHNDLKYKTEKVWRTGGYGGDDYTETLEKYYVDCPVCNRIIVLKSFGKIPFLLKEKLKKGK